MTVCVLHLCLKPIPILKRTEFTRTNLYVDGEKETVWEDGTPIISHEYVLIKSF